MQTVYSYCAVHIRKNVLLKLIEPSVWPNSPDLNPVDYSSWGTLQQNTYRTPIFSMDGFNNRVRTCWENLDKLKAVVRLNGGHSEQLF